MATTCIAISVAILPVLDVALDCPKAVLLSAFLAGRKVRLLVRGCIHTKPRIISVMINDAVH